jgi:4-amino-4-deoxy-L-arabinose transferase-like glycosyltransferase
VARLRAGLRPELLILGAILVAGLALRLVNIDSGLPYVFTHDEAEHFTARAVGMFRQDLDPGYYENPTTFTYLVFFLLRAQYGLLGRFFDLPRGNVTAQFVGDPTSIWISARALTAVLCMMGVAAVYLAGRRLFGRREALVAAAILAFAFLPMAYSRVAVTDVGALVGVSLALLGAARAAQDGRQRDYLLAGGAAGLAISFKYTACLVLLPVGIAALARLRQDGVRAIVSLGLAVALAGVVFAALNPYLLLDFHKFKDKVETQARVARDLPKAGQGGGPVSFYLRSLTWGLGWAAAVAALAGAVLVFVQDRVRGLVLVCFPVALFVYLVLQARYFGRWLLPAYPALALLGAVAVVRVADLIPERRTALRALAPALVCLAVLIQPLAADLRTAKLLGREDTRLEARSYLVAHYKPELRIVIEPAVPDRYYRAAPAGHLPSWASRCGRGGWQYIDPLGRRVCSPTEPGQFSRPANKLRSANYHFALKPAAIDDYRFYGYCMVMTMSLVRGRAEHSGREVRAYYRRLERESQLVRVWSPFDRGARPVPFDFDLSYNYYPTAFARPGPEIRLYRLRDCRQRYGTPVVRVPKTPKVPLGAPPEDA